MKDAKTKLATTVVTAIVTLITSWFIFEGGNREVESSDYQALLAASLKKDETIMGLQRQLTEQDRAYRRELAAGRAELMSLTARVLVLEEEKRQRINTADVLQSYIDALPFPAWIKRKDETTGEFVVVMINQAYANFYGVAKARYENTPDSVIWGEDIAAQFQANDMIVAESFGHLITLEDVPARAGDPTSEARPTASYKFSVALPRDEHGVGGVTLPLDLLPPPLITRILEERCFEEKN